MAIFHRYLMVDWSASSKPTLGRDSIWACLARRREQGIDIAEPRNFATRALVMDYVETEIDAAVKVGERLLAGFDFAFGYPKGAAQQLTGKADWKSLWDLFCDRIFDGGDNANNRFEVAGALNMEFLKEAPLFWGMPQGRNISGLTAKQPKNVKSLLTDKRITEHRAKGAKLVWQLAYAGAVGSQAMVGMARLSALRRGRPDHVRVWPFETGFEGIHAASCILAEIYPSLFRGKFEADEIPDRAQVQYLASQCAEWDSSGYLEKLMRKPDDLDDGELETVLSQEGWILGLGAERVNATVEKAKSDGTHYIRDPKEIYRQSFAVIRKEADLSRFDKGMDGLVIRLIHACGMVDLAADVVFSKDAYKIGRRALVAGAPVICDVEMVRHGIITKLMPGNNQIICRLNDAPIPDHAKAIGNTRSAAQVDFWADDLEGAIVAIGNAPTALFALLELLAAGGPKPALILGFPVGFVGAAESKQALIANAFDIPFISVKGRRGGSAMASAAVNALAGGLSANE